MILSFLKSAIFKKAIYLDSWIILLSSFILSFMMVFTFSMSDSLVRINRLFLFPDMIVDGDLEPECQEQLEKYVSNGVIRRYDLVGNLYGVLETREKFEFVSLKEVERNYFSEERLSLLDMHLNEQGSTGIVLSSSLASRMSVSQGEKIAFLDSSSGRAVLYEVVGIYSTGLSAFDEKTVFLINKATSRNGKGQDKIYADRRSYELLFPTRTAIALFGKSVYDGYDPDAVREIYNGVLADRASMPRQSRMQITSSLDSIRFVMLLFVVLSVCYVFAFIKNFQRRTEGVVNIYRILGCTRIGMLESLSLLCITLASVLTGLAAGGLSCLVFRELLVFLNDSGILSLDYYILKFTVKIPFRDFFIYVALMLCALALLRLLCKPRKL